MQHDGVNNNSTEIPYGLHGGIVAQLDETFSAWWAAFLLGANETLKGFREFGDDDGQLMALALAAHQVRHAAPSLLVPDQLHLDDDGLSLSQVAVRAGIPLETARRTLKRMIGNGYAQRRGDSYLIVVPERTFKAAGQQADALMSLVVALPLLLPPGLTCSGPGSATGDGVSHYWSAVLRYCANLRRRVTRGAYLSCLIAGMIQVEMLVRSHLIQRGRSIVSRQEYNEVAIKMPQPLIPLQQTAIIASETMARTQAAVRHAIELGLGTISERGIFRFSIGAAAVPDDSQAYTRGVKEALADLVLSSLASDKRPGPPAPL